MIQRLVQAVILRLAMVARDFFGHIRYMENTRKIQPLRFPVRHTFCGFEQIGATDQVFKFSYADLRHEFAHFFGDEEEKIHDVFGLAGEFFAQYRVLCCDADRTGIQMAFAHHDAAFNHQRRGREAEFIRTQQCADQDITAGFHLPIDLYRDATTQTI